MKPNTDDNKDLWQKILIAAMNLPNKTFTTNEIINKIHLTYPLIAPDEIRLKLFNMTINHPSKKDKKLIDNKLSYFTYLGIGRYQIRESTQISNVIKDEIMSDDSSLASITTEINEDTMPKYELYPESTLLKDSDIISPSSPELGNLYIEISSLEYKLRKFISTKLGKGIYKKIKIDFQNLKIYERWNELKEKDEKYGITPETDLINYALITDYIDIIKKYPRMFTINDEELNNVCSILIFLVNQGRNPLMHCRTITKKKYYATLTFIDFLNAWINKYTV